MNVLIPGLSGFCPGVKNAEKRIFNELEKNPSGSFSVLGMMINNRKYIEYLTERKIETVENPEDIDTDSTVFIRTHGIDRNLQEQLSSKYKLIDLTCSNVKRVQEIIKKHSEDGAVVFITGKKTHPEVTGLKSYGRVTVVFETESELDQFINRPEIDGKVFLPESYSRIFITSQTTGSRVLFESAIKKLRARWPETEISFFNSICPVTARKESEAIELQEKADISFVIGDPLSSNANKLYKILNEKKAETYFIQDVKELKNLKLNFSNCSTAMVVSSASTPNFVENEVIKYLESV